MTDEAAQYRHLPMQERLDLLPELLGLEAQVLLRTMGEPGPVHYFIADLVNPPLPAYEPSEQDIADYCDSEVGGCQCAGCLSHARDRLIDAHKRGWDAAPRRLHQEPRDWTSEECNLFARTVYAGAFPHYSDTAGYGMLTRLTEEGWTIVPPEGL